MIKYVDQVEIKNKRVLLRVDFNVALTDHSHIADDFRIRQSIPTIVHFSSNGNVVILIAHLGNPKHKEDALSLRVVKERLQTLIPEKTIHFIKDFRSAEGKKTLASLTKGDIALLENIRFYPEEKNNDQAFAQELSSLADIYVNDAFGVSHRSHTSIVNLPLLLQSYGGLLLKKEVESISKAINNPQKPYVALIGGAKISTKLHLLDRLLGLADTLIVGGGIANTLLAVQGHHIGRSLEEPQEHEHGQKLIELARQKNTELILPLDVVVAEQKDTDQVMVKNINEVQEREFILDIGPQTDAHYALYIATAKTIIWSGPFGYIENPLCRRGTDFIYYSIAENQQAISIVGGGETLSAISKKEHLDKITHISTGGSAMLEFIEKGSLPGLDALSH